MAERKDRTVYRTPERAAQRGLRASAAAWGWSWVAVSDGTLALYTNCGIAERFLVGKQVEKSGKSIPRQILAKGVVAYRCLECGHTESSLVTTEEAARIPPRPMLCLGCKEDTCALHAIALQEEWGINLGWRRPALGLVFHHGEDEAGLSLTTTPGMRKFNQRRKHS